MAFSFAPSYPAGTGPDKPDQTAFGEQMPQQAIRPAAEAAAYRPFLSRSCRRLSDSAAAVSSPAAAILTSGKAWKLDGERALFRVSLDSLPEEGGGFVRYDCEGPDEDYRSGWLGADQYPSDEMTVEATLQVIWHPAIMAADGSGIGPLREYRWMRAVRK
jgi:hypothetical protein